MYRSKSSVSLRSLAYSLKQSINFDKNKAQTRQFIPLRSSSSTVNLANNKNNCKKNNFDQEYLILLDTRKSRFGSKSIVDRESNITDVSYNLRSTKQLIQRKQKLLQITKCQQPNNLDTAWHSNLVPISNKQQEQTILTLQLLQKQHKQLKQKLEKNLSSLNFKTYNKLLEQSDNLTKELEEITEKQVQFKQHQKQIKNRILFIGEQLSSIQMNFRQDLAQKQYCEQFLHQYQHAQENDFKQQAINVMKMILLQTETKEIQQERHKMESNLQQLQKDFKQWKVQQNLELKQKRFQIKFKQHRIQLMKIQQHLDHLTEDTINTVSQSKTTNQNNSIRKVRQYICSYFKKYNQININHISHRQIANGIDIFLCKQGLINHFTQFLKQKTQNISSINANYSLKLTQYCDCLKKIQNLFSTQKNQINSVLTKKFQQKIISIKQQIQNLHNQKQKNIQQIKSLEQNIQIILAQQSLSMIQMINKGENSLNSYNKKQGFFNLQQIKSKVKGMKLEQIKRINRVKEIYFRLKKLEQKQSKYTQSNMKKTQELLKQKQLSKKQIFLWKKKINQIQSIKKGYQSKKLKCDQLIDQAINKMKQKDQIEKTIKALQSEIQILKKQKIQSIRKRHLQNKSLDLLGGLKANFNKNENISKMNFFDQTKKILSRNILSDKLTANLLKIDSLRQSSKRNQQSSYQKASAEFCIVKNQNTLENEEKMSKRTQSSPKSTKQRFSLSALNSILLSKCNLVESKNLVQNTKRPFKKSDSLLGLQAEKKQNRLHDKQILRKLTQNSARSSKKSNKQNISRKTSISKNTQRSTIKNGLKRATPVKLSLDLNKKTQNMKIDQIYSNNFSKPKQKINQNKASKKDINTIISNKLLRR